MRNTYKRKIGMLGLAIIAMTSGYGQQNTSEKIVVEISVAQSEATTEALIVNKYIPVGDKRDVILETTFVCSGAAHGGDDHSGAFTYSIMDVTQDSAVTEMVVLTGSFINKHEKSNEVILKKGHLYKLVGSSRFEYEVSKASFKAVIRKL